MFQGITSSDIAVVRDVAAFSPKAAWLHKAVAEIEALQHQRRAFNAPRPNLDAALALRDSSPQVAAHWQAMLDRWAPLSQLGFPSLAQRMANESMAEALAAVALEHQAATRRVTPVAEPA